MRVYERKKKLHSLLQALTGEMSSSSNTTMSRRTTSGKGTTARRCRQSLVIAGAAGLVLIGITGVAEAQVPQQDAPSVQKVSREQADKIMNMNYKEFAELRESAKRPKGYRWDTDGCTPDWAPKYFTTFSLKTGKGWRKLGACVRL
jgi:hypothetical protein